LLTATHRKAEEGRRHDTRYVFRYQRFKDRNVFLLNRHCRL
jgi:hypothetical protein